MSQTESFANSHSAGHVIGGGRYSLHVPLGESNLVWLAQDEVEQRLIAIRFFPAAVREDVRAFDALKQRITAALSVQHPNVCRVIEWYESAGVEPFLAMEYVEGQTLVPDVASHVSSPLTWEQVAPIASSAATGLAALHAAGVVHHCVNPANILTAGSDVKLLNNVVGGVLLNPLFVPEALQRPQALRCFSPQQLAGQTPSLADDFYSFGATLYELLTGTPVFIDPRTLLSDISSSSPQPLRERNSAVPAPVAEFIMACLSKDAARRPASFDAVMIKSIVEAIQQPEQSVVPLVVEESFVPPHSALLKQTRDRTPRRGVMPWLIAACLVLLAGGAAGAWFVKQAGAEKQQLAAAQAEADRLRVQTEQQKREAALLVEKQRKESEARQRAEAELKRKDEQARLAAIAEEKRRVEAAKATTAVEAPKRMIAPLAPSTTDEGFTSLFNGRDLSEWVGDTNYWSVSDGAITGQLSPNAPVRRRFYLTSTKGKVEDFELQFSYRLRVLRGNRQANGGVIYRATTNSSPELSSYQFDLVTDAKNNGAVNDDKRRYRLAGYGEAAVAHTNDKSEVVEQLTDTNKLNAVRAEDWNQCVIVAKGNHLTHYINGMLVADLVDEHTKKQHKSGLVAIELHSRNTNNPAMFMQVRDIRLKRFSKEPALITAAK